MAQRLALLVKTNEQLKIKLENFELFVPYVPIGEDSTTRNDIISQNVWQNRLQTSSEFLC
ncbi:hypothetical protein J6T66_04720 [bacterium]|nr:hypothetical protein [bacterium]